MQHFLDKWLQHFPTDETPVGEQKIRSENEKFWFAAYASSLNFRISHLCGPEASTQKKQWKNICELQKQYEHEQDSEKAGGLLIRISEGVEQLRDGFIFVHNKLYGAQLSKNGKALAFRQQHHDWTDEKVAREAGFAHRESLYQIDGYKQLIDDMQKAFAERDSNITCGSKDSETGDMEAWRQEDGVEKKQKPLAE